MLPSFLRQSPESSPGGGGGVGEVGSVEARRYCFLRRFQQQGSSKAWESRSIYKVPSWMRELRCCEAPYEPLVVSVGPYHHGKEQLEPMELHKHRALRHFLMRAEGGKGSKLEDAVERLRGGKAVRRVRASYACALGTEWDDDYMLAGLMVLDGCFLPELLLTNCGNEQCRNPETTEWCYAADDPISGAGARRHGIVPYIRVDLLRVENQLPLWVLQELARLAGLILDYVTVNLWVTPTFSQRVNLNWLVRELYDTNPAGLAPRSDEPLGLHILDVYRRSRLSAVGYSGWTAPLGAQKLSNHGVKITLSRSASLRSTSFYMKERKSIPHRVYDHFMEPVLRHRRRVGILGFLRRCLRFLPILCHLPFSRWSAEWYVSSAFLWCLHWTLTWFFILTLWWYVPLWVLKAELSLPKVVFDESTEAVLANLMAFEALHLGRSGDSMGVTGYVVLLSSVARTEDDVRVLRERGVVRCVPERGDGEVVGMLGRVTKGLVVDGGLIGVVNGEMEEVCKRRPNLWWASWRRNYWKDDNWLKSRVTTLVAVYALAFASVNMVFAVLTYVLQAKRPLLCAVRND